MEENKFGGLGEYAKESAKKEYTYSSMPENVRQMGEIGDGIRVYIEDYVMTYIKKIFNEKQENAIIILLGKKGKEEAQGCEFIYGVVSIDCNVLEGTKELTADKWNIIYKTMHESFPGAQMLGWGCGVSMWNSRIDTVVQQIQQKYFSEEDKILFVADLAEREERLFLWKDGELMVQSGFIIYYEKNPQMQEYMLKNQDNHSFEENYEDDVTTNMRSVINKNEDKVIQKNKYITYGIGLTALVVIALGANMMINGMTKINNLQQSVDVMKNYFDNENSITEIPQNDTAKNTSENNLNKKAKNKADSTKKPEEEADKDISTIQTSGQAEPAAQDVGLMYESYIVRSGDTLSQIVWRQYHSYAYLKRVKKFNGIKNSDKIYEGDCIKLPKFKN